MTSEPKISYPKTLYQYTVLLVEDNVELLELLKISLSQLGHFQILVASDGVRGLELMTMHRPDCAVIDLRIPGLDGYQLIRALRGDPNLAEIPLIVLTALVQEKDRFAGLASGADIYLTKPIMPQDLIAAIHRAIQRNESDRLEQLRRLAQDPPGKRP